LQFFLILPFLIDDSIIENANVTEYWQLYSLCRDICDIIFAPIIDPDWIPQLELLVAHHHKLLQKIAPNSFTPKVHFLVHYPRLILMFGPLRHLWCMRFEAAHQYFKQLCRRMHNFMNVTSSLCQRYQRKKCCEYVSGIFQLSATSVFGKQQCIYAKSLPTNVVVALGILSENAQIQTARSIIVNGRKFSVGTFVVLELLGPEEIPVFLRISHIVYVDDQWMLCGLIHYAQQYLSHYHGFKIDTTVAESWTAVHTSKPVFVIGIQYFTQNDTEILILPYKLSL
jgi:hypothetical protein